MAELKIISMDEVQSKEVNWLWYPYIPYGKITIIQPHSVCWMIELKKQL